MANGANDPNAAHAARANRLRLAKEDYARATEDAQKDAVAVRKNMARLKELRLAKEADAMQAPSVARSTPNRTPKKSLK